MTRSSKLFDLHPHAVLGSVAASPPRQGPSRVDAEPDAGDPGRTNRRLLALLTRRFEAPPARSRRAY